MTLDRGEGETGIRSGPSLYEMFSMESSKPQKNVQNFLKRCMIPIVANKPQR